MKLAIKVFCSYCELDMFTINEIEADYHDFGEKHDHSPSTVDVYGCGDMRFVPKPYTQKILNKYNISVSDYKKICAELKDKLSFGYCGLCD
jgi:hypothetical protein